MQPLAIGFAVTMIVVLLSINGSLTAILPMLAIYVFSIMRLMPNVQAFFSDATNLRYYGHTVDSLYADIKSLPLPPDSSSKAMNTTLKILPFSRQIILKGIEFSYPASRGPVLKGINLTISKDMTVGFVGTTGCGKTTLVDIIMGLLDPTAGSIMVDDVQVVTALLDAGIPADTASWQRNFGYVPQHIYLSDDTIAANIAFGIPEDIRDMVAVERASQIANLHEFIKTDLPNGYNTVVGERGIRLSGGQRQRIGIARSLYHDPEILVMDEATSALDSVTEDAVMDAIHNLIHSKTIIIIAHRLSTVQECDVICLIEKGQIVAQGSYNELVQANPRFRSMAKVNGL
jgi:ABC-type multidrug transport system fused ATPase/permease subunit